LYHLHLFKDKNKRREINSTAEISQATEPKRSKLDEPFDEKNSEKTQVCLKSKLNTISNSPKKCKIKKKTESIDKVSEATEAKKIRLDLFDFNLSD